MNKKNAVGRMKALFFDLDGTLTDINQRGIEAMYDTVSHFGLNISKARVKQLRARLPSYFDVFGELGLELSDAVVDYLTLAFVQRYRMSVIRKGAEATLETLSKKYTLVCVTSRETLAEVLQELKFLRINRFFKHVVTLDVAAKNFGLASIPFHPFNDQRRKLYECALGKARCSPNSAVAIGDMERELKPAKELGIATIGLLTNEARKKELSEASDLLISSINQLPRVLLKLDELKSTQLKGLNSSTHFIIDSLNIR